MVEKGLKCGAEAGVEGGSEGWCGGVPEMFRRCSGVVSVVVWSENKTVSVYYSKSFFVLFKRFFRAILFQNNYFPRKNLYLCNFVRYILQKCSKVRYRESTRNVKQKL